MPTSVIVIHFPQNLLDVLIGGFHGSIHLRAINSWVSVSNLKLRTYISHQLTVKICTIISIDGLWYSKPAYQIFVNKISYNFLGHGFLRSCFHPLGELVNGNQNKSVSIRSDWLYWTYDIHAPRYKSPRWTHCIESVRHHWDQITMHLTFMTFLHKLVAIML